MCKCQLGGSRHLALQPVGQLLQLDVTQISRRSAEQHDGWVEDGGENQDRVGEGVEGVAANLACVLVACICPADQRRNRLRGGIQITRLQKLLEERKITLDLDPSARAWLADKGYDPVYGARPLKRVIQRELQNPLAEKILSGEVHDGDTVRVTASPLGLLLHPQREGEEVEAARAAAQ